MGVSVGGAYIRLTLEETRGAARSIEEKRGERGRVWLNGILATTRLKVTVMLLFFLFERFNMQTALQLYSFRTGVGIIQSKLHVHSLSSFF